jgi:hypothetical protein
VRAVGVAGTRVLEIWLLRSGIGLGLLGRSDLRSAWGRAERWEGEEDERATASRGGDGVFFLSWTVLPLDLGKGRTVRPSLSCQSPMVEQGVI